MNSRVSGQCSHAADLVMNSRVSGQCSHEYMYRPTALRQYFDSNEIYQKVPIAAFCCTNYRHMYRLIHSKHIRF